MRLASTGVECWYFETGMAKLALCLGHDLIMPSASISSVIFQCRPIYNEAPIQKYIFRKYFVHHKVAKYGGKYMQFRAELLSYLEPDIRLVQICICQSLHLSKYASVKYTIFVNRDNGMGWEG